MSDPTTPSQTLDKPVVPVAPSEPAMFVMPEEYRHGASGKKMAVPTPPVKPPSPIVPPKPPVPPKPVVPKKPLAKKKKLMIAGVGLFVLLAVVGGGYVLWKGMQPKTQVVSEDSKAAELKKAREEAAAKKAAEAEAAKKAKEEADAAAKAKEEEEAVKSPFPTATVPGTDSDSDGLTDLEEKLIYSTNVKLPDTDSDGFLDGNEVFHRYNPGGTAPGTLLESGLVKLLEATSYKMLYPATWTIKDGTFIAATGEIVTLSVENSEKLAFQAWFDAQKFEKSFTTSKTKNGYTTHVQEDGLMELVETTDGSVIQLRYDTGIKGTIDYLQTFKMMVNSLEAL